MATLLSLARMPDSWRAGNDKRMANITFAVFALIIACFLVGPCKDATLANLKTIDERGSDSRNGRREWPLPALWDLPLPWPDLPDWHLPWPGGLGPGSGGGNGPGGGDDPGSPPSNPPGSPPW